MMAGALAIMDDYGSTYRVSSEQWTDRDAIDVQESQDGLDDTLVQSGAACAMVESTAQDVGINPDGGIWTEQVGSREHVYSEWVADPHTGFATAASTTGTDPGFPFSQLSSVLDTRLRRAVIDPGGFAEDRYDAYPQTEFWMTGNKTPSGDIETPDDVRIAYGNDAKAAAAHSAEIGVGFSTNWHGKGVRGVIYASGYIALYNSTVGPVQFAGFIRDCILPHAEVPEEPEEEFTQQALTDDTDEETGA